MLNKNTKITDKQHINIYSDESRHTSGSDDFMVIGAISCKRDEKRELVHKIHLLKKKHNAQGEFGWKRLSPNKKEFYFELIDLFLENDLEFRCIVVDKRLIDDKTFNDGDKELGFYKFYYMMLKDELRSDNIYHIYLDWQQNKQQHRFHNLKFFLAKKLSDRAKISCLEPVTSKNQPLIELADLFIGAVGYDYNKRKESEIKVAFCRKLANSLHQLNNNYFRYGRLDTFTKKDEKKFNIFKWQPRKIDE